MPQREFYANLNLADAVRLLREHHGENRTRHLSQDECAILDRAADLLDQHAPAVRAFP